MFLCTTGKQTEKGLFSLGNVCCMTVCNNSRKEGWVPMRERPRTWKSVVDGFVEGALHELPALSAVTARCHLHELSTLVENEELRANVSKPRHKLFVLEHQDVLAVVHPTAAV